MVGLCVCVMRGRLLFTSLLCSAHTLIEKLKIQRDSRYQAFLNATTGWKVLHKPTAEFKDFHADRIFALQNSRPCCGDRRGK